MTCGRLLIAAILAALIPVVMADPIDASGRTLSSASEAFDQKISAELQRLDPRAAALFAQAGDARERGDHRGAADLYRRVHEMVPSFVHALRRQAHEEGASGKHDVAIALCRRAVALDRSPANLAALALVLTLRRTDDAPPPKPEEIEEGYRLASEASALDPGDPLVQLPLCEIAISREEFLVLGRCVANLKVGAPDDPLTHFYDAIFNAALGRIKDAEGALRRSRNFGLPDEHYERLSMALAQAGAPLSRLPGVGSLVGAVWVGVLLLLLTSGWLLSRLTLRAAGRVPAESGGRALGVDALLRRIYALVLWLCCAFYYASLPLLVVVVLVVAGSVVYLLLSAQRIPLQFLLFVGLTTLATLWAILKSLFARRVDEDPGLALETRREPKLRALLDEVADKLETRPVDSVYLTPGTDIAVMERGNLLRQLTGGRERCLILGVGVLEGMRLGPFRAVLAHEYGHLSNKDTAGGSFALSVRLSLISMAEGLAQGRAAAWYNPAWLFVNGFHRVFLRISQGASRLQEVLADRWAAALYGAAAFEEGLRHVIDRSIRFDSHVDRTLREILHYKSTLQNIYEYQPAERISEEEFAKRLEAALTAPPSPYDSHPSPSDRFAWVRRVPPAAAAVSADYDQPAWDLFTDKRAIEQWLTDVVRDSIARMYDVSMAARPAATD